MFPFLRYVLLGLSLAAPIGPVNAAQLDKGMKHGFLHAWVLGLGAMAADALFMLLIYFGLAHFLTIPFIKTFLWSFGSFVLIYTGVASMKNAGVMVRSASSNQASLLGSFSSGFFLTFSNPISILFWLGVYGSILADTARSYPAQELLIHSSAIFLGLLIWDIGMAAFASGLRQLASSSVLVIITYIAGLSLIGFGIYFGIEAMKLLIP